MQQVQDKLNFPIDVVSDEELRRKFEIEQHNLESAKRLAGFEVQTKSGYREPDAGPVGEAMKRKRKRKLARKARRLARA